MNLRNFDKRIVRRNVQKGVVTEKEYKKYISGLDDLEEECEAIDVLAPGQNPPPEEEEEEAAKIDEATEEEN